MSNAAYIIDGMRTPIGRYGGVLASVRADDLAAHVIAALMARHPILASDQIDEIILGCANQAGEDNRNVARMAGLLAGLPTSVPGVTVNRLCGSGLDAIGTAARSIMAGEADLIIAGGVESMSRAPFVMSKASEAFQRAQEIFDTTIGWRFINARMKAEYGVDSMPETAENVAEHYQISREDQDAFAFRSQARAAAAQKSGRFGQEIAPVSVSQKRGEAVIVQTDEHPRETTMEKLASLGTPFRKGGSVTAGNASGVNDGAAAVLIASARAIERLNLTPLARICGLATAGVTPRMMGIGPVPATQKLCTRLGIKAQDFEIIELNEAFAAQALACLRQLGLDERSPHINPNGGAIALGHPLGMSGARLALTLALEMQSSKAKLGLASMCIGVGQGIALGFAGV